MKQLFLVLILSLSALILNAAPMNVKVIISDKTGSLPGAVVIVKGTTQGTVADGDGVAQLDDVSSDAVLEISMFGYLSQTINVSGRGEISVLMEADTIMLDETVVVGFATQKKVNVTGSVSMISSDVLEDIPVQNAVQALQGQISGLQITSPNGGQLNGETTINIRGVGTIGEGSSGEVLVLIDGVEGDLSILNPQDIESVSVLKDAASSSIYGSRAPFGVILVTTKKGVKGRASINYNNSFRFGQPINMPRMADSFSFVTYFNDAANNSGQSPWFSDEFIQRVKDFQNGVVTTTTLPLDSNPKWWAQAYSEPRSNDNIDYYQALYKSLTFSQEHNLSVSGAVDAMNYYVSANYLDESGKMNFGGDGLRRFNIFGKFTAQIKPWLKLGYNGRFINYDYHCPTAIESDTFFSNVGKETWPIYALYDPNGNLFSNIALMLRDGGQSRRNQLTNTHQINFEIKVVDCLSVIGDATYRGVTTRNHREYLSYSQVAVDGVSKGEEWYNYNNVREQNIVSNYFNANIHVDYEKQFNDHYLKAMLGFQMESYNNSLVSATAYGVTVPSNPTINTSNGLGQDGAAVPPTISGTVADWSTAGFFGRINYNYKDRYMIEGNLRCDGTSRFRSDSRWGLFPSVSAGWNIAKEPFFQTAAKTISTLKLRASYGVLGNQNTTSYYPTYGTMVTSMATCTWLIDGKKPNSASAPDLISTSLTWEKVKTADVGFDLVAFNGRLTSSFDWFIRNTVDMVGPADELPVILGTDVPKTNNTKLRTTGFDFEISWRDRVGDFDYGAKFILSDAKSVISEYSNPSRTLNNYYSGMQVGEIWGYETIGIAKTDEEMNNHLATLPNGGQSNIGNDWQAGDIMYADINGDGKIDKGANTIDNHGDYKVIGNSTPRFNFGLDLNFAWKGIDLRIFFQGVGKRDYMQLSRYFFGTYYQNWDSVCYTQHMDYFRNDPNHPLGVNTDSYYTRPLWDRSIAKNRQSQTRWLQDASYVRLKNLQLGYTLPQKWMNAVHLQKVRVFFSGENLFTLSKMTKLFDPETISGGNGSGNTYPLSRTYSFGLSVTF